MVYWVSFIGGLRRGARPLTYRLSRSTVVRGPRGWARDCITTRKQFPDKGCRVVISPRRMFVAVAKPYVGQPSCGTVDVSVLASRCDVAFLRINGINIILIPCDRMWTWRYIWYSARMYWLHMNNCWIFLQATIRKTIGDFNRTHYDSMPQLRSQLSENQRDALLNLSASASYYA